MRTVAALLVAMACSAAPQSIHSPITDGEQEQWREHVAAPGTWAPDPWEFDPAACGPDGSACSGFSLGNHRAELRVVGASAASSALAVMLRWRRRPSPAWNPATPDAADYATVVVTFSSLDDSVEVAARRPQLVTNFSVINATADAAVLVFQPSLGPGLYSAYYLPYNFSGGTSVTSQRAASTRPHALPADKGLNRCVAARSQAPARTTRSLVHHRALPQNVLHRRAAWPPPGTPTMPRPARTRT